jgi:3-oxo-5alpha-steroid 4-dehydrogenase
MVQGAVSPPLVVETVEDLDWNETADVIVVGFGGAGAVAALQAAECGASVIAIDRFEGGGATAYSGGIIYAGGTRFQREAGYDDTAEEMYKYLHAEGSAVSDDTLRKFCENSASDLDWLGGLGISYGSRTFEDKAAYPPDGYWLYFSGNEKMPRLAAKAVPAPRGHRPTVPGFGGAYYYEQLRKAALAKGVQLIQHAPVSRLVLDRNDRAVGVEINVLPKADHGRHVALYKVVYPWRPFNGDRAEKATSAAIGLENSSTHRKIIRARRGVILATGGFNNNIDMLGQQRPGIKAIYRHVFRLGSMGDDGSGITLGQSAGGATSLMKNISIAGRLVPPHAFGHGVLVNRNAQRFVSESAYSFIIGSAILEQPDNGKAWLIVGADDFWAGLRETLSAKVNFMAYAVPVLMNIFLGGTRRARTLEKLARKIGVGSGALARTADQFNIMAASDRFDPFGKLEELIKPLAKGPFYAINMSLDNKFAPAIMITMGGLKLDERTGLVQRADGSAVDGLYGAGRVTAGLCSGGYMSGLFIADTVFSGRRAGRAAAQGSGHMSGDRIKEGLLKSASQGSR